MRFNKQRQKGFTIIELMIVVAALGVLAALVLPGMGRTNKATLTKRINDEVALIGAQAAGWRGADVRYTGVSIQTLVDQGLLNADWGDGTGANPAGGDYTVAVNSTDAALVDVGATGLPDDVCEAIKHKLTPVAASTPTCTDGDLVVVLR